MSKGHQKTWACGELALTDGSILVQANAGTTLKLHLVCMGDVEIRKKASRGVVWNVQGKLGNKRPKTSHLTSWVSFTSRFHEFEPAVATATAHAPGGWFFHEFWTDLSALVNGTIEFRCVCRWCKPCWFLVKHVAQTLLFFDKFPRLHTSRSHASVFSHDNRRILESILEWRSLAANPETCERVKGFIELTINRDESNGRPLPRTHFADVNQKFDRMDIRTNLRTNDQLVIIDIKSADLASACASFHSPCKAWNCRWKRCVV